MTGLRTLFFVGTVVTQLTADFTGVGINPLPMQETCPKVPEDQAYFLPYCVTRARLFAHVENFTFVLLYF